MKWTGGTAWLAWIFVLAAALVGLFALITIADVETPQEGLRLNAFVIAAREGRVESIVVRDSELTVRLYNDPSEYRTRISPETSVEGLLRSEGVDLATIELEVKDTSSPNWLGTVLSFLPLVVIAGVAIFIVRGARRGAGGGLGSEITRSGARLSSQTPDVTFEDVAGVEEAKAELAEVVDFLKAPQRYRALGARVPKGILLMGPPGTGKTFLARAVAGQAGVPFFSISGSQFVELYVGVGAARVRDLFKTAKEAAPCIVFIDELDAVGRQRGAGLGSGHDEREQTLNQILVELDGFEAGTDVIVLAATNRPDILDSALTRPGRFDRQVILDRPDVRGRLAILRVHARTKKLAPHIDLERLARQTAGFVGADLANILNEGALLAARRGDAVVTQGDLEEAVDRVIAGPQRKSRLLTPIEKRRIAVHEAGHALVSHLLPHADPVGKISIVPRGMAGGYTRMIPATDNALATRQQLIERLASFLGGRAAERLFMDDISTGAEDDIDRATQMARRMVTRWGMSDVLGPLTLGRREELVFLGRDLGEQRDYSEAIAEKIDAEVERLVTDAEETAIQLLRDHAADHQRVVELLLEEETLSGDLLQEALGSPKARPPMPPTSSPVPPAALPHS